MKNLMFFYVSLMLLIFASCSKEEAIVIDEQSKSPTELTNNGAGTTSSANDGDDEGDKDDDMERVDPDDLPQSILDYITTNYPDATIKGAGTDSSAYFVFLDDKNILTFDLDGNFLGVETKGDDKDDDKDDWDEEDWTEIDPADLSQAILDYIAANYPDANIEKAGQSEDEIVVVLDNDMIVIFDLDGNFLEAKRWEDDHDHHDWDDDDNWDEEDWTEIDPADLSQTILDYIAANFPDENIGEAGQSEDEIVVVLDSDMIVIFDLDGNFLEAERWEDDDDHDWDDHHDCDDEDWTEIESADLSQTILDYITANYPDATIEEAGQTEDEIIVILDSDMIVIFDLDGNFLEAETEDDHDDWDDDDDNEDDEDDEDEDWTELEIGDLPQSILDYIAANYPDTNIDEAAVTEDVYIVELDSGLTLIFDLDGNFLGER